MNKEQELFKFCQKFIEKNHIFCAETIYQSDHIIENATEFIEGICNIVGYIECEDEEE
jgi:hypothetical protein